MKKFNLILSNVMIIICATIGALFLMVMAAQLLYWNTNINLFQYIK